METNYCLYDDNTKTIKSIDLTVLGNKEVLDNSVFGDYGVDDTDLYQNGEPKKKGPLDIRMGTTENHIDCGTCRLSSTYCMGHFGHITFASPMFHFEYLKYVTKILNCICLKCSKLLIYKNEEEIKNLLKHKSPQNRFNEIRDIVKNVSYCQKSNYECGAPVSKVKTEFNKKTAQMSMVSEIEITNEKGHKKKISNTLTAENCYDILKNISDSDCRILGFNPEISRPEMLILKVFPVAPVQIRPSVRNDGDKANTMVDDLTTKTAEIAKAVKRHQRHNEGASYFSKQKNEYEELVQYHVFTYQDNENSLLPRSNPKSGTSDKTSRHMKSISVRLKGKEGRIRGNLMGKRVDYSARTVITPDPSIKINELGVPINIAMNLTKPVHVTSDNIEELQKLVNNGRYKYPGANFVFQTNSSSKNVSPIDLRYRKHELKLELGNIVERHLVNGDYVLLNRQPTLHKQSMMAHRIVVNPSKKHSTFRLNVFATSPYNADFDGDEMNIHIPQSIQTHIELKYIADLKNQLIDSKSSNNIIGVIQDSLVGIYNLTRTDKIDYRTAMNVLSYTSFDTSKFVKKSHYSGIEILSYVIPDFVNFSGGGIIIKNGKLIKGVMTNKSIGKKSALISRMYKHSTPSIVIDFLNNLQKIGDNYNFYHGFTVGIGDITYNKDFQIFIQNNFNSKNLKVKHEITNKENNNEIIDEYYEKLVKSHFDKIGSDLGSYIVDRLDEENGFSVMITAGSKGDVVKTGQIIGCIGQLTTRGERFKKVLNNRSTPYSAQYDDFGESRGFVLNSFYSGTTWHEQLLHQMSSIEGLIDTAIKTADSGYIYRRLARLMEDICCQYDNTVRSMNGTMIQYVYGDNGIDTNYQSVNNIKLIKMTNDEIKDMFYLDDEKFFNKMKKYKNKLTSIYMNSRINYKVVDDIFMLPVDIQEVINNVLNDRTKENTKLTDKYIIESIYKILDPKYTNIMCMNKKQKSDTKSIKFKDEQLIKTLLKIGLFYFLAPKRCIVEYKLNKEDFDTIVKNIIHNINRSILQPGEMVGIVSAQSLGEPTTQMTLNSVDWFEQIMIKQKDNIINKPIGEIIDDIIDNEKSSNILRPDDNNEMGDTYYVDVLDKNYEVPSIDEDGNITMKRILAVTKHLPMNKDGTNTLIKITTKTGRTLMATKAKSFLTVFQNKITPIRGDELCIGDVVPIMAKLPIIDNVKYVHTKLFNAILNHDLGLVIARFILGKYLINKNENLKIETYCKEHNCEHEVFDNGNIESLCFGDYLEILCGYERTIPEIAYNANYEFVDGLIDGLFEDNLILHTTNSRLKTDISLLFCKYDRKTIINNDSIVICDAVNSDYYVDTIVKLEEVQPNKKYVYDLTVEDTKTFIISNQIACYDTFHYAGIGSKGTSTLGIPRIRELYGLTKNMLTPKMYIYMLPQYIGNEEVVNKINSYITYTSLELLKKNVDIYYDPYNNMTGDVVNVFHSFTSGSMACKTNIQDLPWLIKIELDKEQMLTRRVTLLDIKTKFCDTWSKKLNDTKIISKDDKKHIIDNVSGCSIASNTDNDDIQQIHIRFDMNNININKIVGFMNIILEKFKIKGMTNITNVNKSVERMITFDKDDNINIHEDNFIIDTDGVNMYDIRYMNYVDVNNVTTNDVMTVYEIFGIEAARTILAKEITETYGSSGININYQHISLLVDLMASSGTLIPITRHGMNRLDNDPLAKASFETPIDQLISSAIFNDKNKMNSTSSRIMAGMNIQSGTGMCDIMLDIDQIMQSTVDSVDTKQTFIIINNTFLLDMVKRTDIVAFVPS